VPCAGAFHAGGGVFCSGAASPAGSSSASANGRAFSPAKITPRFSDGLSVVDAAGQFKTPDGAVAHEPSKLVIIIAPDDSETEDRIAAIEAAYKKQFRQQKVVIVTRTVCASF